MLIETLESVCEVDGFMHPEAAQDRIKAACAAAPEVARFEEIGESEGGRAIVSVILGRGRRRVSLLAGNHSDEPVGPEFLRRLIPAILERREQLHDLLEEYTLVIIPHTNPDGEAHNESWIGEWPSFAAYLRGAFREPPGRDLEFGFPSMRAENEVVSGHLRRHGPYVLHGSLHGMGIGEGGMLLVERRWGFRTEHLQSAFVGAVEGAGLPLHDHNRKGEKGFFYLGPGFSTTPEGEAMRWYFRSIGELEQARKFHQSSMEFVRDLGGDPLCLVTEVPLFVIASRRDGRPAVPEAYLELRGRLPELRRRAAQREDLGDVVTAFNIRPVPLSDALRIQLQTFEAALQEVSTSTTFSSRKFSK